MASTQSLKCQGQLTIAKAWEIAGDVQGFYSSELYKLDLHRCKVNTFWVRKSSQGWRSWEATVKDRRVSCGQALLLLKFQENNKGILEIVQSTRSVSRGNGWLILFQMSYLKDTFTLYNKTNKQLQGFDSNIMQSRDTLLLHNVEYGVGNISEGAPQQFPLGVKQSGFFVGVFLQRFTQHQFVWHMNLIWAEIKSHFADAGLHLSNA